MTGRRRAWRRSGQQEAQATIEFSMVVPVFFALILGAILVYSWQLNINSAQFSAEEGVQTAVIPTQISGPNGILCQAGTRAYNALKNQSFLRGTAEYNTSTTCGTGVPDPANDCPDTGPQTYGSMLGYLNGRVGTATDVAMVCAACVDLSVSGTPACSNNGALPAGHCPSPNGSVVGPCPTDIIEIQVTVVGYKGLPVAFPLIGRRMPFFGQNSQTVQVFAA